jgi:hypothetical protein
MSQYKSTERHLINIVPEISNVVLIYDSESDNHILSYPNVFNPIWFALYDKEVSVDCLLSFYSHSVLFQKPRRSLTLYEKNMKINKTILHSIYHCCLHGLIMQLLFVQKLFL